MLDGYKTYIVSALTILWAIYGLVTNHLDQSSAIQLISQSALAAAIRRGIATSAK